MMDSYEVQEAYTFEWVTVSVHDLYEEAADVAEALLEDRAGEDRVRIVKHNHRLSEV